MHKKKLSLLLSLTLVVSAFIPVVSLALAKKPEKTPRLIEKIVIIHYKRGYGKPSWAGGGNKKDGGKYELLGKGVKWKTPVKIVIDPDNSGLSEDFVKETIWMSAEEWDDGLYSDWGGVQIDLIYSYETVHDGSYDRDTPDGRNELVFGDYKKAGVIAVTIIWGYFSVPPRYREIVEFDIMFDTDYAWGDATIDPSVMDLQNIATHELGHGLGLADLYDLGASRETMFGYSSYGETIKRDLYKGDIAGIKDLYG